MSGRQGYDVKPTKPIKSSFYCPHCKLILRQAVQTENGDRLCQDCCQDIQRMPSSTCADCGIQISKDSQVYPDRAARREISELTVHCLHVEAGCPWKGSLKTLEQHVAQCSYRELQCPNSGCESRMTAAQLQTHLQECAHRQVECKYCGLRLPFFQLAPHYERECQMFPEPCRNCGKPVSRKDMQQHAEDSCKIVQCSVCGQMVNRESTEEQKGKGKSGPVHLCDPKVVFEHTQLLGRRTQKIASEQSAIKADLQQLKGNILGVDTLFQIDNKIDRLTISQKANEEGFADLRSAFQEQQRKMFIQDEKIEKQGQEISNLSSQVDKQNSSSQGPTFHHAASASHSSLLTSSSDYSNIVSRITHIEKSIEELQRTVSIMKVHISELELQLQASLASTHNGCFLWRIPEIARRKRDALEGRITSIYSPPFYSGRNGYKMCIRAYLNGDGSGRNTHFSVFFVLMRGEYDPLLKWPFESKVSLILVDQELRHHVVQTFKPSPDSSSFQRPRSDMNVASGCPQFSSLSVLAEGKYVKDDVAFLKCIIDTTKITHP